MQVYTRTGDEGLTSLATGERVPKQSLRVSAYGDIDELQAELGLARALTKDPDINQILCNVEKKLFSVMSELAQCGIQQHVFESDVTELENLIDEYSSCSGESFSFAIPGDSLDSAALHVARTVCRRSERSVLGLNDGEPVSTPVLKYLNRVSDLLYVLSVYLDNVSYA